MFGIFLIVPVPGIKRLQKKLLAASAIKVHSCPMLLPEALKWGRKILLGEVKMPLPLGINVKDPACFKEFSLIPKNQKQSCSNLPWNCSQIFCFSSKSKGEHNFWSGDRRSSNKVSCIWGKCSSPGCSHSLGDFCLRDNPADNNGIPFQEEMLFLHQLQGCGWGWRVFNML